MSAASKKKDYQAILKEATAFMEKFPSYVNTIDRFSMDVDHTRQAGALFNMLGIAYKHTGEPLKSIEAYEKAKELGDDSAFLNLIELYCYEAKEYEKARQLSRSPVLDDNAWFYKVKVDAYASLMLKDLPTATKCYQLLNDKYLFSDPAKIEAAKGEIANLMSPEALSVLKWFGVRPVLTPEEVKDNRAWFEGLELGWKQQLIDHLPNGKEMLKASPEPTLSDDHIAHIRQMKWFRFNTRYPIKSLKPLLDLPKLNDLELDHLEECPDAAKDVAVLGQLSGIEELKIQNAGLKDLGFLKNLTALRILKTADAADTNTLQNIEVLRYLPQLEILTLAGVRFLDFANKIQPDKLKEALSDVRPLEALKVVRHLELFDLAVSELSVLKGLPKLERLELTRTLVTDLRALSESGHLKTVNLSNNPKLTDISALRHHSELKELDVERCSQIKDYSFLKNLSKLEHFAALRSPADILELLRDLKALNHLAIGSVNVSDLNYFLSFPQLRHLELVNLPGKFKGLEEFAKHPALKSFYFDASAVAEGRKAIQAFKKARPDVYLSVR